MIITDFIDFGFSQNGAEYSYKLRVPTADTVQPIVDFFRAYRKRVNGTNDAVEQTPNAAEIKQAVEAIEPLLVMRPEELKGTLAEGLIMCQLAIALWSEIFTVSEIKKK